MKNRMRQRRVAAGLLFLAACSASQTETPAPRADALVAGYYFAPTAARGFKVSQIRGDQLTHIIYAFGEITADGTAALANPAIDTVNIRELAALKQQYPHLKVVVSFGGWTGSKYFSDAAATAASRQRFIDSVIANFMTPYPGVFDGVDLDWEYPVRGGLADNTRRPEDRENLTLLVRELRSALRRTDADAIVAMAVPAGAGHLSKYELPQLSELLEFFGVMTYDFASGGRIANHNAPLSATNNDSTPNYNVKASLDAFRAAGVPARKLLVGVPFYGRGYHVADTVNHGLLQAITPADSTNASAQWARAIRYYDIDKALAAGFTRRFDEAARVPYLYNAQDSIWISYDDAQSVGEKADYVRENGLGGVMIWELSGDNGTLLPAINRQLGRMR